MKKVWAILFAVSVLGVFAAGCSGGDTATEGGDTGATTPATGDAGAGGAGATGGAAGGQ